MNNYKILNELGLSICDDPYNIISEILGQMDDECEQITENNIRLPILRLRMEVDKAIRSVRSVRDNKLAMEITSLKYER